MSGVGFRVVKSDIAVGTSTKTLVQIVAASNHGVELDEVSISFQGIVGTDLPILVEVLRQTTAGTMSSLTPVKAPDDTDETLQVTAQHTATVEPTAGDILDSEYVHPQSGYTFVFEGEKIGGGDRIGIQTINTGGVDVKASVRVKGRE